MEKHLASTIPANLADLVGNTPMVRFTRVAPDCGAELIGKLESHNPAGSVKDTCAGTLTRVMRGTVQVRDLVKRRNVLVKAGHSYLAQSRR